MAFSESVTLCHYLGGDHCKPREEFRISIVGGFRQFRAGIHKWKGRSGILQARLPGRSLRAAVANTRVFYFLAYEHLSQEPRQKFLPGCSLCRQKTTLTPSPQVRVHPGRLHPHDGVHLPHRHPRCDATQVCEPHLFHLVLPEPFHSVALAGHLVCLHRDPHVHRSVEQPGTPKKPASEGRQEELRSAGRPVSQQARVR